MAGATRCFWKSNPVNTPLLHTTQTLSPSYSANSVLVQTGGRGRVPLAPHRPPAHWVLLCVQTYFDEVLAEPPSSQLCLAVDQSRGAVTWLTAPPWILGDFNILRPTWPQFLDIVMSMTSPCTSAVDPRGHTTGPHEI